MCNEREEKKPVEPCGMASRCPLNGRICECCLNRQETADGPHRELTED